MIVGIRGSFPGLNPWETEQSGFFSLAVYAVVIFSLVAGKTLPMSLMYGGESGYCKFICVQLLCVVLDYNVWEMCQTEQHISIFSNTLLAVQHLKRMS